MNIAIQGFLAEVSKGDLVAVPMTNARHWTMLILERVEKRHVYEEKEFLHSLNSRDAATERKKQLAQFSSDQLESSLQAAHWKVR